MTEMLKQSHTGSTNQHKIVALSKTKEFKPWTMTNRDLEFLKLRNLATSKVTTAYRIPKVLLDHHNAGDYGHHQVPDSRHLQPRLPTHAANYRGDHDGTADSQLKPGAAL